MGVEFLSVKHKGEITMCEKQTVQVGEQNVEEQKPKVQNNFFMPDPVLLRQAGERILANKERMRMNCRIINDPRD